MRTVSADNALRTYQASKRHWARSTGRYDPLGVCVSPCRGGAVTLPSTYRCPSMRKYQKSIQVCHPERNEVESRDLRTFDVFQLKSVRRSFDSRMLLCDCHRQSFVIFAALCSLRMTGGGHCWAVRLLRHRYVKGGQDPSLHGGVRDAAPQGFNGILCHNILLIADL